jgi:hypothetical protein
MTGATSLRHRPSAQEKGVLPRGSFDIPPRCAPPEFEFLLWDEEPLAVLEPLVLLPNNDWNNPPPDP